MRWITGLDWPLLALAGSCWRFRPSTILLVGVAMRCLLLPGTPVSNDLFRYVWDGRVQAAGINPYLHVPIGLPIYVPCILILITEFALRRRRKTEEPHADAVIA